MSFIVKGIDIPADTQEVMIIIYNHNNEPEFYKFPQPKTDIISISKPHGRIVDINKVTMHPIYGTADTSYDAPTILESEV